jgi:hypothetical protein
MVLSYISHPMHLVSQSACTVGYKTTSICRLARGLYLRVGGHVQISTGTGIFEYGVQIAELCFLWPGFLWFIVSCHEKCQKVTCEQMTSTAAVIPVPTWIILRSSSFGSLFRQNWEPLHVQTLHPNQSSLAQMSLDGTTGAVAAVAIRGPWAFCQVRVPARSESQGCYRDWWLLMRYSLSKIMHSLTNCTNW